MLLYRSWAIPCLQKCHLSAMTWSGALVPATRQSATYTSSSTPRTSAGAHNCRLVRKRASVVDTPYVSRKQWDDLRRYGLPGFLIRDGCVDSASCGAQSVCRRVLRQDLAA